MLIILQGSDRFWRWLRIISGKSTGRLHGIHSSGSKAAVTPRNQEFAATGVDLKNMPGSKAANTPRNQEFAATGVDPTPGKHSEDIGVTKQHGLSRY